MHYDFSDLPQKGQNALFPLGNSLPQLGQNRNPVPFSIFTSTPKAAILSSPGKTDSLLIIVEFRRKALRS